MVPANTYGKVPRTARRAICPFIAQNGTSPMTACYNVAKTECRQFANPHALDPDRIGFGSPSPAGFSGACRAFLFAEPALPAGSVHQKTAARDQVARHVEAGRGA